MNQEITNEMQELKNGLEESITEIHLRAVDAICNFISLNHENKKLRFTVQSEFHENEIYTITFKISPDNGLIQ